MWRCLSRTLSNRSLFSSTASATGPKLSIIKSPIPNPITTRSYYTSPTKKRTTFTMPWYRKNTILKNKYTIPKKRLPNPRLVHVLIRTQNIGRALDEWVSQGFEVDATELQLQFGVLCRRNQWCEALQVSEWMVEKGVCKSRKDHHLVQLDLIGRVRGLDAAEEYFGNLGEEDKDRTTYNTLLKHYVRERETEKSVAYLRKCHKMGFISSPLVLYNGIMCLYTNGGRHEKVPGVLAEMKENNISPDNFSYRICINSYGVSSDLEGVEKVLKEMKSQPQIVRGWKIYAVVADFYIKARQTDKAIKALKKAEMRLDMEAGRVNEFLRFNIYSKMENQDEVLRLDTENGLGYNSLISRYANLGKKDEVLRLWGLKNTRKCRLNRNYICMLASLVRLGELKEAEKVLMEWGRNVKIGCVGYDFRVPETVVVGYSANGLVERAEAFLRVLVKRGKETTLKSWEAVAAGYAAKGEVEKAVECLKDALNLKTVKEGKEFNDSLIRTLLNAMGNKSSLKDVEAFVGFLRKVMPMKQQMYDALLKAYIRGSEQVNGCDSPKVWRQYFLRK